MRGDRRVCAPRQRDGRGWSQAYLAEISGIGRPHISDLETGRREAGLRTLEALAGSFELTISQLLKGIYRFGK